MVSPLFFVTYGLLFWMIFFVIFLSWLLEWMYIQALEDKNICQDLAALCKFFALQESTSSVNHVPVNFYFNFLINSHLVCTYLYFTDDWRSVSEYRIHSIQYFTLQFHFHIKHLLIFHFVYLYKKKNYLQCHRQCSFSPFYLRHHLCF